MATLILLRHGQSVWNLENLFTGWVDVDLSERGIDEAGRAGAQLAAAGLLPDVLHTSLQRRAIRTAELALHATGSGSRGAGRGGSTSATTARSRARTRSRRPTSSASNR
jgi:bisphosphoglycerate-dependent phosphoglycerate mutase